MHMIFRIVTLLIEIRTPCLFVGKLLPNHQGLQPRNLTKRQLSALLSEAENLLWHKSRQQSMFPCNRPNNFTSENQVVRSTS